LIRNCHRRVQQLVLAPFVVKAERRRRRRRQPLGLRVDIFFARRTLVVESAYVARSTLMSNRRRHRRR